LKKISSISLSKPVSNRLASSLIGSDLIGSLATGFGSGLGSGFATGSTFAAGSIFAAGFGTSTGFGVEVGVGALATTGGVDFAGGTTFGFGVEVGVEDFDTAPPVVLGVEVFAAGLEEVGDLGTSSASSIEDRLGAASGFFASGESYCFEVEVFGDVVEEAAGVTGFGAGETTGFGASGTITGFAGSGVLTDSGAGFTGAGFGGSGVRICSCSDTSGGDSKLSCPNNESISTSSGAE